ncbi:MAG: sulfite exporter TauE/SafE family protein [Candidatus Eremiobacteraeota bacterium]|nr:sulfite exporter TauE/SafE family protein [Candidatus Eremiobacteraeota bacterium]
MTFPALLFAGVAPINANATSNAALWVGTIGSASGYREEIVRYRHLMAAVIAVSLVGALIGAILLIRTPPHLFTRLIPFLLLFAWLVFLFSPYLKKPPVEAPQRHSPVQLVLQFLVAIYGGYFGGGMGFIMLAILSFSGLPNMNAMNAIKNALAVVINGAALVPFIIVGIVEWPQALIMAIFAVAGGYFGSRFFRRIPSRYTRAAVLVIGAAMTAVFFIKTFA